MNYFYHPIFFEVDQPFTLPIEESHHALRVLRLLVGDDINLINGMGQKALGKIQNQIGKQIEIQLIKIQSQEKPNPKISVALALLKKKDRLEWFIEKAVELGADQIIIFTSEHTEKQKIDKSRLDKIAISALKQSGNLWLPDFVTDQGFTKLISENFKGSKFIAHCEDDEKTLLKQSYKPGENVLILIGPEGDFSSKEIEIALKNDFVPVSLGNLRLRAETAALAALITLKVLNE